MQVWQHESTVGATATRAQIHRVEALEQGLGRKHATLLVGPAETPGAYAIAVSFDSRALRRRTRMDERCGLLFNDGYVAWGTRDEMVAETPLVDRWQARNRALIERDMMAGHLR